MLIEMVREMVNEAAQEIGYPEDEGNLEMVLFSLKAHYDIELNEDASVTWQLMRVLTDVISDWQANTEMNHVA